MPSERDVSPKVKTAHIIREGFGWGLCVCWTVVSGWEVQEVASGGTGVSRGDCMRQPAFQDS